MKKLVILGPKHCFPWVLFTFIYSVAYVAILISAWLNCFKVSYLFSYLLRLRAEFFDPQTWASWGAGEAREELQRRIGAWHAAMFLGFWWVKENTPRLAIYSRNGGKASRVCPRIRHPPKSTGLRPQFLDTTIAVISCHFH